jgi:hypothetical protein
MPLESERQAWVTKIRAWAKALKRLTQGRVRRAQRLEISARVKKREEAFRAGKFGRVINAVLRRHRGCAKIERVELPSGELLTNAAEVNAAARDYFQDAFKERLPDWLMPEGVPILKDTHRGRELREMAMRGELPKEWEEALGAERFNRLQSMWKRKAGLTEAMYGDLLREITEAEWDEIWAQRSRTSAAGGSGTGTSHWKECPGKMHELARSIYSSFLRLKLTPRQWKREIVVPIEKKAGAQ